MSETMQGRRVSSATFPLDYELGDYGKRGSRWWMRLPNGDLTRLDDRWTVTEHDDGGTITVSPSIFHPPYGWHGYLEHGVWRSV